MIYKMATHKDIDELCELRWEYENTSRKYPNTVKEGFVKSFKEYLEELLNKSFVILCAVQGNNMIGALYANVFFNPVVPEKPLTKTVYINDVFVKSGYRKQGVGRNIMNNFKNWANTNAVQTIIVEPNKDGLSFFKNNSFESENGLLQLNR